MRSDVPTADAAERRSIAESDVKVSGLQKGPAERGHVKKRQKSSKSVKKFFDTFRHFSRRAKSVKNRQKVSKHFSTLFDKFRAAPFFRPFLGGSEKVTLKERPSGSLKENSEEPGNGDVRRSDQGAGFHSVVRLNPKPVK